MAYSTYLPNESLRVFASITIFAVPIDPATLTLHVQDASGNVTTYASPVEDTVGNWHQDITIPPTPAPGIWSYYWTSTGFLPNQQGVSATVQFMVSAAAF